MCEEVAAYAEFLAESGCDIMVTGLPMRRSWDADEPLFVDVDYASRLADVLNRMGYETLKRGVRLAIHPETHAVFWLQRDLDLFLALTDPVYVGFCPDTAHITLGGTDVVDVFRKHHQRIIITHWKDAKGRVPVHNRIDENIFKSHHPFFSRVGTGDVNWKSWAEGLRKGGLARVGDPRARRCRRPAGADRRREAVRRREPGSDPDMSSGARPSGRRHEGPRRVRSRRAAR